jgi:hypothetical protein
MNLFAVFTMGAIFGIFAAKIFGSGGGGDD